MYFIADFALKPRHKHFHQILYNILFVFLLKFPVFIEFFLENPHFLTFPVKVIVIVSYLVLLMSIGVNLCGVDLDIKNIRNSDYFVLVAYFCDLMELVSILIAQVILYFDIIDEVGAFLIDDLRLISVVDGENTLLKLFCLICLLLYFLVGLRAIFQLFTVHLTRKNNIAKVNKMNA